MLQVHVIEENKEFTLLSFNGVVKDDIIRIPVMCEQGKTLSVVWARAVDSCDPIVNGASDAERQIWLNKQPETADEYLAWSRNPIDYGDVPTKLHPMTITGDAAIDELAFKLDKLYETGTLVVLVICD